MTFMKLIIYKLRSVSGIIMLPDRTNLSRDVSRSATNCVKRDAHEKCRYGINEEKNHIFHSSIVLDFFLNTLA